VSPGFAEQVRRQIGDDVMASIGVELSELSVSPEFAVRVRQQIEATPPRSRWFGVFSWRWAVPVAAAAVVLVAIAFARGGHPDSPGVGSTGVVARGSESPSVPPIVAGAPQSPRSSPGAAPRQPQPDHLARVSQRTTPPAAASGQQAEEKLEVITNQPAVLRDWWDRAERVQIVSNLTEESARVDSRDVVVNPVEVKPVVVQWLVDPPPSVTMPFPFIRRVAADWAERSSR
jgi:hypothetical protein